MEVGDRVRLKFNINESPSEDGPGGNLAKHDEILIIRRIAEDHTYPIKVSHEHIEDRSFGVLLSEIELV
jgi:hypothetical protein